MTFQDHFSDRASGYARSRPRYPQAAASFLAALAPGTTLAYEVGCGSGQLTGLLASYFEHVAASDPSVPQLSHAVRMPGISYICALAETSPLRSAVADLTVAAQSAHWFDLLAFFAEARRVTRREGVVALVSYGVTTVNERVDEVMRDFDTRVLQSYWPPERRHIDAGYATIEFPFREVTAPRFEMQAEWTLEDMLAYVDTWSAVRAMQQSAGNNSLEAFRVQLAEVWGEPRPSRLVRWPLAIRAGYCC